IDQLQIVSLADQQRELRQVGNGSIRLDRQRDSRTGFVNSGLARVLFPLTPSFVRSATEGRPALSPGEGERRFAFGNERGRNDRFVELQIEIDFRTFDGAEAASVFDTFVLQTRVF